MRRRGPIDVAILGLGKNGHLGFNEPAGQLEPYCHLATLTPTSKGHGMMKHAPAETGTGHDPGDD